MTQSPPRIRAIFEVAGVRSRERAFSAPFRVGRTNRCELCIDSPLVSREHLEIRFRDGCWRARDLGSRNGTWLNAQRIEEVPIRGDVSLRLAEDGPILYLRAEEATADRPRSLERTSTREPGGASRSPRRETDDYIHQHYLMIYLSRPEPERVRRDVAEHAARGGLSYSEVGASRSDRELVELSGRYEIDRHQTRLGAGAEVFSRARRGLEGWEGFRIGWVEVFASGPPHPGMTVGVTVSVLGIRCLNVCRVVYVIDEREPLPRFGFAYGTLGAHMEQGEERFTVWHDPENDDVLYEIVAFSRPRHPLARIGKPVTRQLQRRFAIASLAALSAFVRASGPFPGSGEPLEARRT